MTKMANLVSVDETSAITHMIILYLQVDQAAENNMPLCAKVG